MKTMTLILATILMSATVSAATKLDKKTLQGTYTVKAKDVYMEATVALQKNKASMIYKDLYGKVSCTGTYRYDDTKQLVSTNFEKCGNVSVSHTLYFEGQTVESLKQGAEVLIAIDMGSQHMPAIPFTVKKLK